MFGLQDVGDAHIITSRLSNDLLCTAVEAFSSDLPPHCCYIMASCRPRVCKCFIWFTFVHWKIVSETDCGKGNNAHISFTVRGGKLVQNEQCSIGAVTDKNDGTI
ncbi:hypothetical protein XELAEV_18039704mg [Xenopus laevis]|uniref:Uncharacterized protein n=1 Tax=Xenopus laevis TaxID=8355 RepID=A0A974H8B9_XENLA|nr:hypothetical protein XELAEV_18039704mg [Xenopus laevis]